MFINTKNKSSWSSFYMSPINESFPKKKIKIQNFQRFQRNSGHFLKETLTKK
jgi:hypothetical protein